MWERERKAQHSLVMAARGWPPLHLLASHRGLLLLPLPLLPDNHASSTTAAGTTLILMPWPQTALIRWQPELQGLNAGQQ